MKHIGLIALALLAGCGTTREPGIEVRTVETVVTRVEKCVAPADIPTKPARLPSPRPKHASRALDVAVAKVMAWERYGSEADPLLQGCAG